MEKGLELSRAERSMIRTLSDQIPVFLYYLVSLLLGVRVVRHLPFSVPRKWVPAIARGAVSLRGNSSRRNGMHRMGYVEVGHYFSQENLVAFLFGDISRSLAVPVLCVYTYTHALHKN